MRRGWNDFTGSGKSFSGGDSLTIFRSQIIQEWTIRAFITIKVRFVGFPPLVDSPSHGFGTFTTGLGS